MNVFRNFKCDWWNKSAIEGLKYTVKEVSQNGEEINGKNISENIRDSEDQFRCYNMQIIVFSERPEKDERGRNVEIMRENFLLLKNIYIFAKVKETFRYAAEYMEKKCT